MALILLVASSEAVSCHSAPLKRTAGAPPKHRLSINTFVPLERLLEWIMNYTMRKGSVGAGKKKKNTLSSVI